MRTCILSSLEAPALFRGAFRRQSEAEEMSCDIRITRAAERDLNGAADCVEYVPHNPQTADGLLDEAGKKTGEPSAFPEKPALVDDPR